MEKIETHLHTSEGSACASIDGAEQARFRKAEGYDAIIVTNHFYRGNTAPKREQSWEGYVNEFCLGYEHAKEEGDKIGLKVFFGWEENYYGAEFLIYGLDKEWLLRHPDMIHWDPREQYEHVKADGGMIIQAHPMRERGYLLGIALYPQFIDGVEVINSSNTKRMNDHAKWYAEEWNLRETAGSDIHHKKTIGGGILVPRPINSIQDYVDVIMDQEPYEMLEIHSLT